MKKDTKTSKTTPSYKISNWTTAKIEKLALEYDDLIHGPNQCYGIKDIIFLNQLEAELEKRKIEFNRKLIFLKTPKRKSIQSIDKYNDCKYKKNNKYSECGEDCSPSTEFCDDYKKSAQKNKKEQNKLIEALNRMDELASQATDDNGDNLEPEQLKKDYNRLFDFIIK